MIFSTLTLLAGCGISKEAYPAEAAKTLCAKMYECASEEEIEAMGYEDEADCTEQWTTLAEDAMEEDDDCEYDAQAAQKCLDAVEAADCDDEDALAPSECDDVCPSE